MARYIFSHCFESILLIIAVLVLVFFSVHLTGDPVNLMASRSATEAERASLRKSLGLDRPLSEQFVSYMVNTVQGNLGTSLSQRTPNLDLILQRLPATLELATVSLLMALVVAIPLGVAAGMNPSGFSEKVANIVGLAGQVIPSYWLALLLIVVFAVQLRLLPSFGRDSWRSLVLPAFALSFNTMGQLVRLTRSSVLEVHSENYVQTARAKGLNPRTIAFKHVLRNAAIPLVSVIGISFTYLLGGSVFIETIFAWPGLGTLLQQAIGNNDFPLVQAITLFIALFAIGMNLLTNLAYGWLDPRLRLH
ncbi:MAG: ABC transporter permease [Anaerolineae bacterium]|nr:ABC transporter permease [Anaerolineae bacterium]